MAGFMRLLVANRGEIAVRILRAARELSITAIAIYHGDDSSHIGHADEAIALPSSSSFTDIPTLVSLCQSHSIEAVHPGYGFLSESADFASALSEAGIVFVGPSADVLRVTGDKLSARKLAQDCGVPVLPALTEPTQDVDRVRRFASERAGGWPVMLKAVDGGGGRGIRLVRREEDLKTAFERATAESPSKSIFAEKALVDGCRHVEVQILGDGNTVTHFWERECSIQRRYQKVVEIAPSTLRDGKHDKLAADMIKSAIKIAEKVKYRSLGTFEFLALPDTGEHYFMEVNPRLQVEHTITEAISSTDLVELQLRIAAGLNVEPLPRRAHDVPPPPGLSSIQLRVTAEDPRANFALSIGKIKDVVIPGGNGVRVDTHVERGTIVSADYDSLLAKVIVTALDPQRAIAKGLRALADLRLDGITTNTALLAGILLSEAFHTASCDTHWLEQNLQPALDAGTDYLRHVTKNRPAPKGKEKPSVISRSSGGGGGLTIKKGDKWNVTLEPQGKERGDTSPGKSEKITIQKVSRNDLPHAFAAEIARPDGSVLSLRLSQADAMEVDGGEAAANKKQADARNANHLACPLSGQLVEMLVDEGDVVKEFDSVAIVRQMKMELEIRAHKGGVVREMWDVDDGENVSQGMLVCEIVEGDPPKGKL